MIELYLNEIKLIGVIVISLLISNCIRYYCKKLLIKYRKFKEWMQK